MTKIKRDNDNFINVVAGSWYNPSFVLANNSWTEIDDIKAGMRGVNILASVMRKDKKKQNMYYDTKNYKTTVSNWNNEDRIMLDDDGYSVILLRLKGSQIDTFERGNILQIKNVFARKDKEGMIYLETTPMSKIKKIGDDIEGVDFQGMRAGLYEWEI